MYYNSCFDRQGRRLTLVIGLLAVMTAAAALADEDPIILDPRSRPIRTGSFSKFADFQDSLWRLVRNCAGPAAAHLALEADARLGPATARAIQTATRCPALKRLPKRSAARAGAITQSLWRLVMGDVPMPDVTDRAAALVLSFEATDFSDAPEWNFCQDNQAEALAQVLAGREDVQCHNATDPCSMLTWGPRGATAGQGGEIQWILWKIWRRSPELLAKSFGAEYPYVRRFLRLQRPPAQECYGVSPVEHFMCAVWIDPERRRIWETALVALGHSRLARDVYDELYATEEFDGYKLRAYYRLWSDLGLQPSELDFAFFYDRATHIGAPPGPEALSDLKRCMTGETGARTRNASARRCLARLHPHPTVPTDRQSRDLAYYIDSYPRDALSGAELRSWMAHIPLDAAKQFGLSDDRPVPFDRISSPRSAFDDAPPQDVSTLTDNEKSCPISIRAPIRSLPPP